MKSLTSLGTAPIDSCKKTKFLLCFLVFKVDSINRYMASVLTILTNSKILGELNSIIINNNCRTNNFIYRLSINSVLKMIVTLHFRSVKILLISSVTSGLKIKISSKNKFKCY